MAVKITDVYRYAALKKCATFATQELDEDVQLQWMKNWLAVAVRDGGGTTVNGVPFSTLTTYDDFLVQLYTEMFVLNDTLTKAALKK